MAGPSNLRAAEAFKDAAGFMVLAAAEAISAGSQLLRHETGILFLIKSYDRSCKWHSITLFTASSMMMQHLYVSFLSFTYLYGGLFVAPPRGPHETSCKI